MSITKVVYFKVQALIFYDNYLKSNVNCSAAKTLLGWISINVISDSSISVVYCI